jgi:hypothetical protein
MEGATASKPTFMKSHRTPRVLALGLLLAVISSARINAGPIPAQLGLANSFFDIFIEIDALATAPDGRLGSFFDVFVDLDPSPGNSLLHPIGRGEWVTRDPFSPGGVDPVPIELLAMNLVGVLVRESPSRPSQGATLRESPTRQSHGRAQIESSATGPLVIHSFFDVFADLSLDDGVHWQAMDSFFDVFTELSLDNGQTWFRVSVPDQGSSMALLLIPAVGIVAGQLRRRQSAC